MYGKDITNQTVKVKQSHYRPGQAQMVPGSPRFRENGTGWW